VMLGHLLVHKSGVPEQATQLQRHVQEAAQPRVY